MATSIKFFTELIKPKISLSVGFTAFVGAVLYSGNFSLREFALFTGVFLLSAASAAINQIQESHIDINMQRTEKRPVASGKITSRNASVFAFLLAIFGFTILYYLSPVAGMLGILNAIIYNLIYTPLKQKTIFALIPGAVVGAIPPFIGWYACTSDIPHDSLFFLGLFLFFSQIPHFWLLLFKYRSEYKNAGFPTVFEKMSYNQISRTTIIWVLATVVSSLMIPFGFRKMDYRFFLIASLGAMLIIITIYFLFIKPKTKFLFICLNVYILLILISTLSLLLI